MRKSIKIILDEEEYKALKLLSNVKCSQRENYVHCNDCPFSTETECICVMARTALEKYVGD